MTKISEGKTHAAKVRLLKEYDCPEIRLIFKLAYDHSIQFDLPRGEIKYTPSPYFDQQGNFVRELKFIGKFLKGNMPDLRPEKRLNLFIQTLEMLDPNDAKILLALKDKTLPVNGIYRKAINEAYGEDFLPGAPWFANGRKSSNNKTKEEAPDGEVAPQP